MTSLARSRSRQPRCRHQIDGCSQLTTRTDPLGAKVLVQYAQSIPSPAPMLTLGAAGAVLDPSGTTQKLQNIWGAGRVTDANGNTHQFEYDKAGQLVKETRPLGGAIALQYDAAGQLTQRTDAGGNTRAYSYDQAGRMTQEAHKLAGTTTDETTSYSYDADGQMTAYEQKDASAALISSASYTRDAQGRTTQSAITYGKVGSAGSFSFTLGQGFNADGQLQSHTYPDGSTGTYAYDKGHLAKVTLPDQSAITYGSYQWQVPTSIAGPGATKTLTLDALQRPLSIEVKNSAAQILASRAYQYDAAGDITQINSDLGKTEYGYDQLSRLTKATPDQNLQALGLPAEQYSYDAVHNRTSSLHQAGAWSYNKDNQLTQYPQLKPFTPGDTAIETSVTYNAQGHTSKETSAQGEKSYGYNAAERLIQYSNTPAGQATAETNAKYRYDPFGRRIAKAVTAGQTSKATYFLYGDSGLMGEADSQGAMTKAYAFSPLAAQGGLWSTDPIWQADLPTGQVPNLASNATFNYLQTDHLGTPMLATTKMGALSWKAVSEAFGAAGVLQGQSTTTMNLRFPGQYFDEEAGTHYNFHRDYKPNAGRYVQGDPIGLNGGINKYAYVNGNVLQFIDPLGKKAKTPIGELTEKILIVVKAICKKKDESCQDYYKRVYKVCTGMLVGFGVSCHPLLAYIHEDCPLGNTPVCPDIISCVQNKDGNA